MTKTRKWLAGTSLGLAVALSAAACSSSGSDSSSTGSSNTPQTSASTSGGATTGPSESSSAAAQPLSKSKITIAVPGISAASAFLVVADQAGIFKENGLEVTLNEGVKPPDTPAAMIKGSIDGASLTGTATKASAKGIDVVNIVSTATHEPFVLVAAEGIKSLNDLVGKSIVTSSPTNTPGTQTAALLRNAGLTGKVKVVGLTSTAAESAFFVSKQADAEYVALNQAMNDIKKRPGSTIIMDNSSLPTEPSDGVAVARSFLNDHPDVVKAIVKSCLQAAHMMRDEPDKAAPFVAKVFNLDPDEAKQFLQYQAKNIVLTPPTEKEFANVAEEYSKIPGSDVQWTPDVVAKAWDTSFQTEILKDLGYTS